MRVLVTGSRGFVGKNLVFRMRESPAYEVLEFVRGDPEETLGRALRVVDAVVHLAGENRPASLDAFDAVNRGLTQRLCELLSQSGRCIPVVLASSTQAELDNPYGRSKLAAETEVEKLAQNQGNPVAVFRLPGVFGKWCRPDYNSVVATFCHNIANDLPIHVNDPSRSIRLVYVDDVVEIILGLLVSGWSGFRHEGCAPEYVTTLGALAAQIEAFRLCRSSLVIERVGSGLGRALYATYVSYLPPNRFSYEVLAHSDARGTFVEMLKTSDSGQFSFFTAHPGVTRGSHYHHTKTEKFLVVKGRARFGFRHVLSGEVHHLETSGDKPQIVESIPGWAHDITNVGDDDLIVMLWANENFDRNKPDTIASKV